MNPQAALRMAANVTDVRARIAGAARRARRDPAAITLVAVTKNRSSEDIRLVVEAGVRDLGENRVQELLGKLGHVEVPARWHFIGHLQRNKVRDVVGRVDLIHSLDSMRLAEAVSAEAVRAGMVQSVLIQANIVGEQSKHGFRPDDLEDAVRAAEALPGLLVRGLMFMAPIADGPEALRPAFAEARAGFEHLAGGRSSWDVLSAGMTQDFEIAIEEGSTLVRVGTALFA